MSVLHEQFTDITAKRLNQLTQLVQMIRKQMQRVELNVYFTEVVSQLCHNI